MPTDGLTRYDKLSGRELVVELRTMDRNRFPKNYETLLSEIEARGPVVGPQLEHYDVERYESLSSVERRRFRAACTKRALVLLLQYNTLGGLGAAIAVGVVAEIIERSFDVQLAEFRKNAILITQGMLLVASYWAFLRWILKEKVSGMSVAILREKKNGDAKQPVAAAREP